MPQIWEQNELIKLVNDVLYCNNDFLRLKSAIDRFYTIFSNISHVDALDMSDSDIFLPSGKAISTPAAAHCLLELQRTAVFLRGIKKAIDSKIVCSNHQVKVLYAGCGPYATLVAPLLCLYTPNNLSITLIDINSKSLEAAKLLLERLGYSNFIENTYLTDASTFTIDNDYDIVISETMLACLAKEPQVAITQNLLPQLRKDALFIPEQITVDAYITSSKQEVEKLFYREGDLFIPQRMFLGNILTVNSTNLDSTKYRNSFEIPTELEGYNELKLFTTVKIFDNEILTENDSSITLPKRILDLRVSCPKEVSFWYTQGKVPKIEFSTS